MNQMNDDNATNHQVTTSFTSASIVVDHTARLDWIIPVAINLLLMLPTLWILFALIHYGVKTEKWRRKRASHLDMLSIGLVYTSVVVCAVMCMMLFTVNFIYLNAGFSAAVVVSVACDAIADTAVACYGVMLFAVALFLWSRQRVFYRNEMLSMDYNKCVKFLSFFSIILIFVGALSVLIVNIMPNSRRTSPNGCIFEIEDSRREVTPLSVIVLIVLGQLLLLGLFAYALIKTKNSLKPAPTRNYDKTNGSFSCTRVSNVSYSTDYTPAISRAGTPEKTLQPNLEQNNSQSRGVRLILQKTLLFAVLSTISDIFIQILIHYLTSPTGHRRYVATATNVNAFLNLVFLLLSFVQWKDIVLSPCRTVSSSNGK